MRRGRVFLLVVVVVLVLLAGGAISILHDGLSARAKPSALETVIARTARKMAWPKSARDAKNPIPDSPEVQKEARLHFADHCAICHGNDGSGDTMIGNGLYPNPPDLRADETQNLSDGEIFWIIQNGVRLTGMPSFAGAEEEHNHNAEDGGEHAAHNGEHADHGTDDSWKLVRFVRHLPHLTTEEKLEMEQYNPKGPEDRHEEQEEEEFLNGIPAKPAGQPEHHKH